MTDLVVAPLAQELLECLRTQVALLAKPPKQVCLRAGDIVSFLIALNEDECCAGLAWVRVASAFPSNPFPEPMAAPIAGTGIVPSWAVVLEMGVVRCAPTGDVSRNPTCQEWTDTTLAVLDDAAAMRDAFCCFAENRNGRTLPGSWEPLPVEGACTGGTMLVTVRANPCAC